MTINGKTEEEILRDFFELVAQKEWFSWADSPNKYDFQTELRVDEILAEDFEDFARGRYDFDWEAEEQENLRDMYRSAGL